MVVCLICLLSSTFMIISVCMYIQIFDYHQKVSFKTLKSFMVAKWLLREVGKRGFVSTNGSPELHIQEHGKCLEGSYNQEAAF